MAFEKRITLPGSERKQPPDAKKSGTLDKNSTVNVTVVLRRKGNDPVGSFAPRTVLTRAQYAEKFGSSESDIHLVEQFAQHCHLTVGDVSLEKRRVVLTGTAAQMAKAFGAKLACFEDKETKAMFRGRTGAITVPAELKQVIVAVLGLDERPVADPHFRAIPRATATSLTPPQVAALYNFPKGLTGAGQTVAIIELGGGFTATDVAKYFTGLGIKTPPKVTAVSVDGAKNKTGSDDDAEVQLDIDVVGAIAPGANIAVYFAPNTDQGFVDAITNAVHDSVRKPSVISISWGASEDSWTAQARAAMDAAFQDAATLGVTVTAAAGDNGSTDGAGDKKLHVDFPASSPYVLACGGTKLAGSGSKIASEVVWNETASKEGATGGGISNAFPIPSYQSKAGVPPNPQTKYAGRGVPDVAGNADPTTGYKVRINGKSAVIGGTSAVAPLWAALIALLNQKLGKPVGYLHPKLYSLGVSVFNDIKTGNNDDAGLGQYSAGAGWDACTGLGTPNGAVLLNALTSTKTKK